MNQTSIPSTAPDAEIAVESILHVAWKFPLWAIVVMVLSLGAMIWWLYWSERGRGGRLVRLGLATIRFTLLMLVVWMLSGWSWLRFKSDQPELIVVVDRSASMNTRDVGPDGQQAKQSRAERALELFQDRSQRELQRLKRRYQLQWFTLAESLDQIPVPQDATQQPLAGIAVDGGQSRLGDGLTRLLQRQAGKGTAAVIFLSDGINTSGAGLSDAAKAARRAAVPIMAVALGRQTELPDVRLADLLIDREVYLGDMVTAEVAVIASDVPTTETRITIRDRATEKILDETRVVVTQQQRQLTARLSFVPERAGELPLRIEVSPVDGEEELDNNVLETTVQVHDKTIRVLLVSELPSYEFRFLKSFFERSMQAESPDAANFELHTVLQDADPLYVDQDKTALRLVPSNPETLAQYDSFVLIDFAPQLISQTSQQGIVEAVVRHGAGCIFVSGNGSLARRLEGWPLAKLLPVERDPTSLTALAGQPGGQFRWQLTPLGSGALPMQLAGSLQESLGVWQRLPDFSALGQIEQLKSGAQVLSQAVDRQAGATVPLLITQFAGAGRTALQATDETYRWASFFGNDLPYQRYWGQMLRWLSRGKLQGNGDNVELIVDPKQANLGQPIRFQVTLGGELARAAETKEVELAIDGSGGRDQTIQLPRMAQTASAYQTTLSDISPGSYRAVLVHPLSETPASVDFTVTAPPGEQASLRANVEDMRHLAEQSRGRFYLESEAERLFDELPPGKPTRLGPLPSLPIWNAWWVALLFVLLITSEWILRRRYQML